MADKVFLNKFLWFFVMNQLSISLSCSQVYISYVFLLEFETFECVILKLLRDCSSPFQEPFQSFLTTLYIYIIDTKIFVYLCISVQGKYFDNIDHINKTIINIELNIYQYLNKSIINLILRII